MTRASALLGSAIFLIVAPFTVGVWLPWSIADRTLSPWPVRVLGAALFLVGAAALLDSFFRFAWQGRGTPAPLLPTRRLIVSGWYRYVRNPMYIAVLSLIAGQALVWASGAVVAYGAVVWLAFHAFVTAYEEPKLLATYGEEYRAFCRTVPRWIPRLRPQSLPSAD